VLFIQRTVVNIDVSAYRQGLAPQQHPNVNEAYQRVVHTRGNPASTMIRLL
jgi:hypothetical protein